MVYPLDPSPDRCPSNSGMDIEDRKDRILWLLKVRGVGAILLRSQLDSGKWVFSGMSIYTDAEIGHLR